jgi:cytochrome c oxidase subunit IV
MKNAQTVRGLFLILFSCVFGLSSLQYPIGRFGKAGPGLFPLVISCMLLLIGLAMLVHARFMKPEAHSFNIKNIAVVILSLCGFGLLSTWVNMTLGILFLVFSSTYAGQNYSVVRNFKIFVGLWLVAFAFKHLLGLSLPLY